MLSITIIITWLITVITLYIGYQVGYKSSTGIPVKIQIPNIFKKKSPIGAIKKASQREIELKGTRREETEKAMEQTLDEII